MAALNLSPVLTNLLENILSHFSMCVIKLLISLYKKTKINLNVTMTQTEQRSERSGPSQIISSWKNNLRRRPICFLESIGGPDWKYFSAVCWEYGRHIYDELQYPVGLIATTWGGTPVEAWSSPDALSKCNTTQAE